MLPDNIADLIERHTSDDVRSRYNGGMARWLFNDAKAQLDARYNRDQDNINKWLITVGDITSACEALMRHDEAKRWVVAQTPTASKIQTSARRF